MRDTASQSRVEQLLNRPYGTALLAFAGSLLLWAALPPVSWWPVAWVAPIPWLMLIDRPVLRGRRPYLVIYLAGFAFWLAVLHWLRLPHPATSIGWLALSLYLGCYLPTFVALSRTAVHALRWSIVWTAPVIWAGLELAQSHLLTGINIATPGHSQYRWTTLIQVSDLFGGYTVSFVIMLAAACVVRMLAGGECRRAWWPALPLVLVVGATLAYGHYRTSGDHTRPGIKVALIQGAIDSEMKADPTYVDRVHQQYFELTRQALRDHKDLHLIVWPETMYRHPLRSYTDDVRAPDGHEWNKEDLIENIKDNEFALAQIARQANTALLLGMDRLVYGNRTVERYNSAVLIGRDGRIVGYYDKMRPVMFGEYVPLARYWPWLYRLTPLDTGIEAGTVPRSLEVSGVRIAPNICFETLLPHFIRGQVAALRADNAEPDILVNLTNDGWFWGSSELDLHLMAGAFRAVECRKPLIIAANTGFSAVIDGNGAILQQGRRHDTDVLVHTVDLDNRHSPYVQWGDWGASICLLFAVGVGLWGLYRSRRPKLPMSRN